MRVIHVVTLVSPDGAFGGPVRVAFNQARQLITQGCEVTIAAPCRGYETVPESIDGVPVHLTRGWEILPAPGFAGMVSPSLLWWIWRHRSDIDVMHVHQARDLLTLPVTVLALLLRKRVILQTHGMVVESRHPAAPLMDWLLTRRVLRRASAVLYLNEGERAELEAVEPAAHLQYLPNGVPVYDDAKERPATVEVLFVARLHKRKRPLVFVEAAAELLKQGVTATFRLVGPDEGEAAAVQAAIDALGGLGANIAWEGPVDPSRVVERIRRASIYVLPSVNEPIGMSILEAMSVGLPVIVTDSCGLARLIDDSHSGIVVDDSVESLAEAMRRLILDAELRESMGRAARQAVQDGFSMDAIGRELVRLYE
jgi:glycosyltransferase involved in cell wall biosynthesis